MGLYGVIQGACGAIEAYGISIGISKVGYKIWCVYIVYNALQLVGECFWHAYEPLGGLTYDSIVLCLPGNQQVELGGNRCSVRDSRCSTRENFSGHPKGQKREGETG